MGQFQAGFEALMKIELRVTHVDELWAAVRGLNVLQLFLQTALGLDFFLFVVRFLFLHFNRLLLFALQVKTI